MVNCTAAEHLDMKATVYGDYMDGTESIIFEQDSDLERSEPIEMNNQSFQCPI